MKTTIVFDKLYRAARQKPRYISSCGGARSSKTFSALQLLYYLADRYDKSGDINSVVSETFPHLKRGAIRDFKMMLGDQWDDARWSATDSIYTLPNGSMIEFFSVDAVGKVHGPQRKRLFVNEVQNIKEEILRQLAIRTQSIIFLDYNPTHSFFVNDKIELRADCVRVHSTYKDNQFLSPEQVAEIESNMNDANWWRVYGEGKVGTLEGLIYSFEQIDVMPEKDDKLKEVYGLDFGFTNDPTSIVRMLVDTGKKIIYADERCYRTRMMNADIAELLRDEGMSRATEVFADCAEPKSIAEIRDAGINITACDKDAPVKSDKLVFQIQWMMGWKLYVTKQSVNIIKELRNYTWAKGRNGETLNQPIDTFNHALDAIRYGMWSKFGKQSQGHYNIIRLR